MSKLLNRLKELEKQLPNSEKLKVSISSASVGWHIEHTVLTTNKILHAIAHSNPREYKWEFNLKRILVFTINKIPRGKGKAPLSVQPQGSFASANCSNNIQLAINTIKGLPELNPHNYFEHPFFGKLDVAASIRFLNIHTNHHLKIINDIVKP